MPRCPAPMEAVDRARSGSAGRRAEPGRREPADQSLLRSVRERLRGTRAPRQGHRLLPLMLAAAFLLSLSGPAQSLHQRLAHPGGHAGHDHAPHETPGEAPGSPDPAGSDCTLCHALHHTQAIEPAFRSTSPVVALAVTALPPPERVKKSATRGRPPDRGPPAVVA